MTQYLALFAVVSVLSAWSEFDSSIAAHRDEFLPLINFEPFVYILFIFTGVSILLTMRSRISKGFASMFVLPFSAGLTGWSFGITLAQAFNLNFANVAFGIALTGVMALVTLAPAIVSSQALKLAEEVQERWFVKRRSIWAINILGVWLLASGFVGLVILYVD